MSYAVGRRIAGWASLRKEYRKGRRKERKPLVYARELDAGDLFELLRIERACQPRGARRGFAFFSERFSEDDPASRLSLGLVHGKRLVGYFLATVRSEAGDPRFFVDDIAILPSYGSYLGRLLEATAAAYRRHFGDLPIVTLGLRSEADRWAQHRRLMRRLGTRFAGYAPARERSKDRRIYEAVWEPVVPLRKTRRRSRPGAGEATYGIGGSRYSVERVSDEDEWYLLREEWNDLVGRVQGAGWSQRHERQRQWWLKFGVSSKLYVLLLRKEGRLSGIAPLCVTPQEVLGKPYRRLSLIGSRREVNPPVMLFPVDRRQCADLTARYLLDRALDWDFFELPGASGSPELDGLARSFAQSGYSLTFRGGTLGIYQPDPRLAIFRAIDFVAGLPNRSGDGT